MREESSSTTSTAAKVEPQQSRLRTLLLLLTAIATTFSAWRVHREIEATNEKIEIARLLARDLKVSDESQYALVYENSVWEGERKHRIYLPPGRTYVLHVSLEAQYRVPASKDTAPSIESITLDPGEHTIQHFFYIEKNGSTRIHVYCDDELIYDEVHGAGWLPYNYAFTEKTDEPLISIQRPTHTPLEIWRGVWQHPPPPGYVERVRGLILWVEPDSS